MERSPLTQYERGQLADALFPDSSSLSDLVALEKRYPPRAGTGEVVVRFAPSPTGFVHLGALYTSLINSIFARQSKGIFILRIEDTDEKRQVEGASNLIVRELSRYGICPDEGPIASQTGELEERGLYGPYFQSARTPLYRAHVRHLVAEGLAYPCFCTEDELKEAQEQQRLERGRPGYYGRWAKWRDASLESIFNRLQGGASYVIRFRSSGNYSLRCNWNDLIHGRISQPENDLDAVLLKSTGTSLYHLAHVVDDHLMRVTHVVRGDEWLSSAPLHRQLFAAFGYEVPQYAHLAPIQKLERVEITVDCGEEGSVGVGNSVEKRVILHDVPSFREVRRKLSKRKDPEARVEYYLEEGIPEEAVLDYLMNLADSGFEEWRQHNEGAPTFDFKLLWDNFNRSGALVDLDKLHNISKNVIAKFASELMLERSIGWCERFDHELYELFVQDRGYTREVLDLERSGASASKRIASFKDLRSQTWWFFDKLFHNNVDFPFPDVGDEGVRGGFVRQFLECYAHSASKEEWFARCKEVALQHGFASSVKEFKKDPTKFRGHIGDATMILRVALAGLRQTPDLYLMMQVLTEARVRERLGKFC